MSNSNNINGLSEDKKLIKIYIGKSYNKLILKTYSYSLLFLGPIKMIYNNMILQTIGIIIIQSLMMIILPFYFFPIIYAITNLIIALCYNKMYLNDAKYKVYEICSKENETNKIIQKIKKVKEKSTIRVLLGIIFYVTCIILSFMVHDVKDNERYGKLKNLNFSYSSDFIIESNYLTSNGNACKIIFNYSNTLSIQTILEYYSMDETVLTTEIINNDEWKVYKGNNKRLYVYTSFNNTYFINTINSNSQSKCNDNIDKVINTFSISA